MNLILHNVCEWDPYFAVSLGSKLRAEKINCIRFQRKGNKASISGGNVSVFDIEIESFFEFSFEFSSTSDHISIDLYRQLYFELFLKYHKMRQTLHNGESVYVSEHYFRGVYQKLYNMLSNEKYDYFISSIDFAYGWELILDRLCDHFAIKKLYLFNNYGDRFVISDSIDNFGLFGERSSLFPKVNKVSDIAMPTELKSLSVIQPKYRYRYYLNVEILAFLANLCRSRLRIEKIVKALNRFRSVRETIRYRRSFRNLMSLDQLRESIDLASSQGMVYCPLHLQPESSSIMRSDIFEDQILKIEFLASRFQNSLVVVKDNLNQTNVIERRSTEFFGRLGALRNVVVVDPFIPSSELLNLASVVATLNGTSGIEAILRRVPVIYFGQPFFRSAPGAYSYRQVLESNIFSIDDFLPPSDEGVKHWIEFVSGRMGVGNVIDAFWGVPTVFNSFTCNDYSIEENRELVSLSLVSSIYNKKFVLPKQVLSDSTVKNTRIFMGSLD